MIDSSDNVCEVLTGKRLVNLSQHCQTLAQELRMYANEASH